MEQNPVLHLILTGWGEKMVVFLQSSLYDPEININIYVEELD